MRSNAAGHFDWLVRKEMKCQLHPPHQLPQEANNSLAPAHVRGCARYGQRGPDEETEMNFMSARQCPAVKATRTARWCQHRKVCFQVPMHFATDAPHVRVNQSESRLALFSSQCNSIRQLRKENPPRLAGYPGPESSALSFPMLEKVE